MIAKAFEAWSNVANITFTPVIETADGTVGDIRIAFSSAIPAGYRGYSLGVSDGRANAHGDIWIDDAIIGQSFAPGTYNYMAMLHEIGHSLGLKHTFEAPEDPGRVRQPALFDHVLTPRPRKCGGATSPRGRPSS
jgi:serralysin